MVSFLVGMLALALWGKELISAEPKPGWAWLRWPAALLLGSCAVIIARRLFDRTPQIVIDADGILMRHWSEQVIPWSAIKRCRGMKWPIPLSLFLYQRLICLDLHDPALYPRTTWRRLAFASRWDPGNGDITMMTAGLDQEFPELMSAIRPHAAAAGVEVTG